MKRMKTSNHAILPSSRLYTLIAIVLYATPCRYLIQSPYCRSSSVAGIAPEMMIMIIIIIIIQ